MTQCIAYPVHLKTVSITLLTILVTTMTLTTFINDINDKISIGAIVITYVVQRTVVQKKNYSTQS